MAVALFPQMQLLTDQSREIGLAKVIEIDMSCLTAIRDGLDRIYEFGNAVTSNGSAQPKTVQKLAAPGIDGNGHNIVDAFTNRVKRLMPELKNAITGLFFQEGKLSANG